MRWEVCWAVLFRCISEATARESHLSNGGRGVIARVLASGGDEAGDQRQAHHLEWTGMRVKQNMKGKDKVQGQKCSEGEREINRSRHGGRHSSACVRTECMSDRRSQCCSFTPFLLILSLWILPRHPLRVSAAVLVVW